MAECNRTKRTFDEPIVNILFHYHNSVNTPMKDRPYRICDLCGAVHAYKARRNPSSLKDFNYIHIDSSHNKY